jgi:hypothetical protein
MTPSIKITRYPYEEPYHLNLVMEATNGRIRGQIEFYINSEELIELADEFEVFPGHASAVHLWELGSEKSEDRFAYYFRFRLFTTDSVGYCAIQLRFNNNEDLPDREISEFCIPVEPSGLNRLGKLFREFAKLNHEVLYWEPNDGKLYATQNEAEQKC